MLEEAGAGGWSALLSVFVERVLSVLMIEVRPAVPAVATAAAVLGLVAGVVFADVLAAALTSTATTLVVMRAGGAMMETEWRTCLVQGEYRGDHNKVDHQVPSKR